MAGCAKILLFIFNLIFVILGVVLIVSGILVTTSAGTADSKDFDVITSENDVLAFIGSAGVITIILGVLVFIVAFCGCCGAIKENKLLLTIFVVLLLIILVLEIVGAVLGYVFRGQVDSAVTKELMQGLDQYNYMRNDTGSFSYTWDKIQMEGECCGVSGPGDWANASATGAMLPGDRTTPLSCACDSAATTDADPCKNEVWTTGCKDEFIAQILGNLAFSGTACVVIILAEIFGIIFACCVIRDADKETA